MGEKVHFGGKPLIPSKYLEAADLNGKRVTVEIERIVPRVELAGPGGKKDRRPVFYLRGKEKGWVMNSTNLNRISEAYGKKADQWIGARVVIYAERVESFGSMVPAVRVDVEATMRLAEESRSRANGNGKEPSRAPDEPRHNPDTGEVIEPSSGDEDGDGQSDFDNAMADGS